MVYTNGDCARSEVIYSVKNAYTIKQVHSIRYLMVSLMWALLRLTLGSLVGGKLTLQLSHRSPWCIHLGGLRPVLRLAAHLKLLLLLGLTKRVVHWLTHRTLLSHRYVVLRSAPKQNS